MTFFLSRALAVDEKRFWDIIATACPHDATSSEWDEWHEGLHRELSRLDPEDLLRFDRLFEEKAAAAYTSDFAAARLALNGETDDYATPAPIAAAPWTRPTSPSSTRWRSRASPSTASSTSTSAGAASATVGFRDAIPCKRPIPLEPPRPNWGPRRSGRRRRTQQAGRPVCWQQGRSALDFLSQLLRGTPVTLALHP